MYYLSFFIDRCNLLRDRLNCFLNNDLSNTWIYSENRDETPLESLDDVPTYAYSCYSQSWYIHGSFLKPDTLITRVNFPLYNGPNFQTSFAEIDRFFKWLSLNYLWSVFPWGGPRLFSAFVFLSRERHLLDRFINSSSMATSTRALTYLVPIENRAIASYEVVNNFSESMQALLFSGYYKPAARLWNLCQGELKPPLLITDVFDEEIFSIFSWYPAKYKTIDCITINRGIGIYQPLDRKSFGSMCQLTLQEPDTLIIVPQGTNLRNLENLLFQTEDYNSYSDLIYFQKILATTEWFYGLDRDRVDYGHSFFVARDNVLLHRFAQLDLNDSYKLISCF
jgi:hypothetical protein